MTHQQVDGLTTKELVGIYNGLSPDAPLTAWKGKKAVLIERIETLRQNVLDEPEPEAPTETAERPGPDETKPEVTGKTASTRTIREAAIDLLCRTVYHEDRDEKPDPQKNVVEGDHPRARSVGMPYNLVLGAILTEFPGASTSVACLRWYSVKIRAEEFGYEDLRLPQRRPRARPTKG